MKSFNAAAITSHTCSNVRGRAARRNALSLANTSSIGLKSGLIQQPTTVAMDAESGLQALRQIGWHVLEEAADYAHSRHQCASHVLSSRALSSVAHQVVFAPARLFDARAGREGA